MWEDQDRRALAELFDEEPSVVPVKLMSKLIAEFENVEIPAQDRVSIVPQRLDAVAMGMDAIHRQGILEGMRATLALFVSYATIEEKDDVYTTEQSAV